MTTLTVEQRRGFGADAIVEAEHPIDAVLCHQDGSIELLAGSDLVTTLRSAGKPFQLEAALAGLPAELRSTLRSEELAIGTASHQGERFHIAQLEALLLHLGVTEHEMLCGAHAPTHTRSAESLIASGEAVRTLHNNCAGKHAFMAAASRAQAYSMEYRPSDHPLQQAFLRSLAQHSGYAIERTVVDGCGVPCPALPLSAMARAYASLAHELDRRPSTLLGGIAQAMRGHPLLVGGSGAFDSWLMQHCEVIAKVGALGLLCIAVPSRGVGMAIKVRSGCQLARPVATGALLERHLPGVLTTGLPERYVTVQNVVGREVGSVAARFAP